MLYDDAWFVFVNLLQRTRHKLIDKYRKTHCDVRISALGSLTIFIINLLDDEKINWQRLLGPRQITAAYLLAVAVANDG